MEQENPQTPDAESLAEIAGKRIFTTGEAAAFCKVSQQTIIRCFDSGRLTGFRVPGSKFRRIPREDLLRFMRANNMPTQALDSHASRRVLAVDDDEQVLALYRHALGRDSDIELRCVTTAYDAGLLTESFRPHLILLDFVLPDLRGDVVCARIRDNPAYADIRVLAVSGVADPRQVASLREAGAHGFLPKPFSGEQLRAAVAGLLDDLAPAGGTPTARGRALRASDRPA